MRKGVVGRDEMGRKREGVREEEKKRGRDLERDQLAPTSSLALKEAQVQWKVLGGFQLSQQSPPSGGINQRSLMQLQDNSQHQESDKNDLLDGSPWQKDFPCRPDLKTKEPGFIKVCQQVGKPEMLH